MEGMPGLYDACILCFMDISTDARALNLARSLIRNGKKVCIIAPGDGNDPGNYRNEDFFFLPVRRNNNNRVLFRWAKFILDAKKYENIKAKTYWASDLYSLYNAKKLAQRHNGTLYYDSREIYSALGPLAGNPVKQKVISYIEKRLVPAVEGMIVSGGLDADYLREYFGHDKPYHIIMNLPPYREYAAQDKIRQKYSLPTSTLILLYQGEILKGRGLLAFARAIEYLDNTVLFIMGEGPYRKKLEEEVQGIGVADKILFHGRVPYDELHEWTCSADLGIVFNRPVSFSYKMALPNKLFEYCMAGLPSLASDIPAQRKVIEESGIGILISPEADTGQITAAIESLRNREDRQTYIDNCLKNARRYSYESQDDLINSLV